MDIVPTGTIQPQSVKSIILALIVDSGLDPVIADKVLSCESGYNPAARHWNLPTATRPGTWDVGPWQINDVHGLSEADRTDLYTSTAYAIKLIKGKGGWGNWTCYKE